jgi:hypothetical protein
MHTTGHHNEIFEELHAKMQFHLALCDCDRYQTDYERPRVCQTDLQAQSHTF